ncbi:MAG: 16S rRNA (adenine(1518)-N(6)/adenine(1519)-N(6))-dimethyltransferase RsmA [Proteobacteria bacterium]|nr:16S rRNA (adenine(1518)-N(6)/adenine(1519)-N(6))-dimethyltransferase RsmA [Pseudomonadota bacterium]
MSDAPPAEAPSVADLPPLREVIRRHGLAAQKRLGQHFLLDLNLTARIARAAGDLTHGTTIEIGPGPGGLTRALLDAGAAHVVAIEKDRRCTEALADLVAAARGRLALRLDDAATVDAAALGEPPRRIVANLPYNVGTHLLIGWLKRIDAFESLTLMFQKEVALRLTAAVGGRDYGRLSVLAQYQADVRGQFRVPARAFTPPPKVDSMVVRLTPRSVREAIPDLAALETVTAAAFGQRRKMLRAALKPLGVDPAALLAAAGLLPTARAETVGVAGFAALARAYGALR